MKTKKFVLVGWAVLLAASISSRAQSVPQSINYQGQLANADGTPLASKDYRLTFSIYAQDRGGTEIWGPQTFPSVPVAQGYFNVILGSDAQSRPVAQAFTGGSAYLEIKVDDSTMSPRQQILSAPYAFRAANADTAVNATKATNADKAAAADKASSSDEATHAARAATADSAAHADKAALADKAAIADKANAVAPGSITSDSLAPGVVQSTQLANGAVTANKIAPRVVGVEVPAGGLALSDSCGNVRHEPPTAGGEFRIPQWKVNIETTGRPVWIQLVSSPVPASSASHIYSANNTLTFQLKRTTNGTTVDVSKTLLGSPNAGGFIYMSYPSFIDRPTEGKHTYEVLINSGGHYVWEINYFSLLAFEL